MQKVSLMVYDTFYTKLQKKKQMLTAAQTEITAVVANLYCCQYVPLK